MASKRANGEGSVTFDKARGTWVGRLTIGTELDGKPKRQKFRARTQTEVIERMNKARKALDAGLDLPNERLTVSRWMAQWLTTLPGTVSVGTEETYHATTRLYVLPAVGDLRLAALRPSHVDLMLRDMEARGLSGETRRLARAVLRRALRRAEQEGLVGRNVAAIADGPKIERRPQRALSEGEARAFLVAAAEDRLGAAILLALAVGLRRGETLGLTWDALDLDGARATARIERQLLRTKVDGKSRLGLAPVKTAKSRRTVVLPDFVVVALRKHRSRQAEERLAAGAAWHDAGLVFTTPMGTPADPRNFNRLVSKVAERAGLGHWNPHALRHSAVSLLLASGVPLEVVSEVVGHSSIRVTKDVYGHLVDAQRQGAADAMQSLFGTGT